MIIKKKLKTKGEIEREVHHKIFREQGKRFHEKVKTQKGYDRKESKSVSENSD